MKRLTDQQYHEARAAQELRRAEQSDRPEIAAVHRQLSALHRRRMLEIVHFGEPQLQQPPLIGLQQPRHRV